ncbi:hypothetical protein C9374_007170 [Naegleria lovaniensis]|uniref:Uncharacterized protein n=1 Tax=Naegleria lovaniensis TaxID=51637 RepID=A0AA88KSF6_NAELO|nr:uncharacterized protein C9374_007170 [Naegleria lovaniensis]KAG2393639.1 hypothetical protein C9374_007170 [Naegleria lovaniensis]
MEPLSIEKGMIQDFMPSFFELSSDRFIDEFQGLEAAIDGHLLDHDSHPIVPTFTAFFERVYHGVRFDVSNFSALDAMALLSFNEAYCKESKYQAIQTNLTEIAEDVMYSTDAFDIPLLAFQLLYHPRKIKNNDKDYEFIADALEWLIDQFDMKEFFYVQSNDQEWTEGKKLHAPKNADYDPERNKFFFHLVQMLDSNNTKKDVFRMKGFGEGCFELLKQYFPENEEFFRRVCGMDKSYNKDDSSSSSPSSLKRNVDQVNEPEENSSSKMMKKTE